MADKKISQLTGASTPLAGTEVLPIVQSGSTVKVASNDLTVKNVRSNATTGILQIAGPAAAATRTMTVPDANFTAARTDAGQTFTGNQTFPGGVNVTGGKVQSVYAAGGDFVALFQNTTSATPYGVWVKDAASPAGGYPLVTVTSSDGLTNYLRIDSSTGNVGINTAPSATATKKLLVGGGDVEINNGNLIVGTSGKGIDFSATAGTGTSELFADYEEGAWTPIYKTTGTDFTSVTYDPVVSGRYTKIGNKVFIEGVLRTDAITVGAATGDITIQGLPFTANASGPFGVINLGVAIDFDGDTPLYASIGANSTIAFLYYRATSNGPDTALAIADLGTAANKNYIYFVGQYTAA